MANIFKLKTNAAMPASAGTPLTLYTGPGAAGTHKAIVLGLILGLIPKIFPKIIQMFQ